MYARLSILRRMPHQSKVSRDELMLKIKAQSSPKVLKAKLNTLENFVKRLDAVRNPSLNIIRKKREVLVEIKQLKQQLGFIELKNKRTADARKTPAQLRQEEEARQAEATRKTSAKNQAASSSFTSYIPSTSIKSKTSGAELSGYDRYGKGIR